MLTRRSFIRSIGGVAAVTASLNESSIERVLAATRGLTASAESLATDENFWREIQHAFTVDRTLINLNNGGVSPSPRVVQDALRRYLEYSNEAPVHTMWRVLEPQF
jgi:hypothetical protein